jgi:hypothetical protein
VRVEEKQIITAVGVAGHAGMPVPPPSTPMPPGPASLDLVTLGGEESANGTEGQSLDVVIDRCPDRVLASVTLPIMRTAGVRILAAGLAAEGTRLDVARALAVAGVPRPTCLVAFSEESGVEAANRIGYPSTLLPLAPGSETTAMLDQDTADAVIEHRVVLGKGPASVVLIQQGAPRDDERTIVHVVGGRAIAVDGNVTEVGAVAIAEHAARVVGASIVAVELVRLAGKIVVWDLHPVADFRKARLTGEQTIGEAIAELAIAGDDIIESVQSSASRLSNRLVRDAEVRHDVVLSA